MPWNEATVMDQRKAFVEAYWSGRYGMTELCRSAGVSRPTGYLWLERYRRFGEAGLVDRSHAPRQPQRTAVTLLEPYLELRRLHPRWGARKLLQWMARRRPEVAALSHSTLEAAFKARGLVDGRRPQRLLPRTGSPVSAPTQPNDVWSIDFKGQFRTGDHRYCYPLTLTDSASRYVLATHGGYSTDGRWVERRLHAVFAEQGLPAVIHSDNGSPFASSGLGGLSWLSIGWLKLGIELELSRPGHPEDNPRHERMHRELKAETARPPAANLRAQQRRFDRFRCEYNEERPHESLHGHVPADLYRPSSRPLPARVPEFTYPGHFEIRRVRQQGVLKWHRHLLYLGQAFGRETVGLEEIDDGVWNLFFGTYLLGRLDEPLKRIIEVPRCKASSRADL
jgi:putative transposase